MNVLGSIKQRALHTPLVNYLISKEKVFSLRHTHTYYMVCWL